VDIGLTHDSSAVAVAWARADGKIVLNCTVWSAVPNVLAHVTVPGGTMDLGIIEQHIMYLHELYQIDEMAYDPRFFERSAQLLADHMVVVPMQQTAAPMADAYQTFYQGIHEKRVLHNGDGVLTAHVMATAAQKGERGWKISKIRSSHRIDAVPASAVAIYRAEANLVLGDGGVIYG
jgi:phage terminase large subunit-like protein